MAPPERPSAPKPGQQQQLPAAAFDRPSDTVLGMPGSIGHPSLMQMPQFPSSEAPKLKDFLPFMKPGSFGPKAPVGSRASAASNDCAPGSAGSLPASVSASPVHLPQAPVSFPPSPQRQPPGSVSASDGHGEVMRRGYVHDNAGYPVAEALLSPTAPPGAPRSASPAHQQPDTAAHPGGPVETRQLPAQSYNIPHNVNQSSTADGVARSGNISSRAGAASVNYATQNGHPSSSQFVEQLPAVSMPLYSVPNLSQPGIGVTGMHTQHNNNNNASSFQNHVPGQPSVLSNTAAAATVHPGSGSAPQHGHLPHSIVGNIGTSANWNQSYPSASVGNVHQPVRGMAVANLPVHQTDSSGNMPSQFGGNQPPAVEATKHHYYQIPPSVPPVCTAVQLPYQPVQPGNARPPSYELVTQRFPPPAQLLTPGPLSQSAQPGFAAQPSSSSIQPGLSSAGMTAPLQASYLGPGIVSPQVSYGNVPTGHLPASSQQPVAGMPAHHAQTQQPPPAHQMMSGDQRTLTHARGPQHRTMPVSTYVEQQPQPSPAQPRYPLPSHTVPGLPVPHQYPSAAGQAPSQTHYSANVQQMPATQQQPTYSTVPSTSHAFAASAGPSAYHDSSHQPMASQIPPVHSAASHMQPAVTNQQQQYPRYPIQPSRPEMNHSADYLHGNVPQSRYPATGTNQVYPASSQPTAVYRQPQPVNSQPVQYQSCFPQQQPLYHPDSSQPPIVTQSSAISSQLSTPHVNQQQPRTNVPYSRNVNNVGEEIQAFADIPVCLPSPLQPSRVSAAEVSKNIDSLRDLDLSLKTKPSADDAPHSQRDSSEKLVGEAENKDVTTDASVEEQPEKTVDETQCSLHRSRSSRDVYADVDTLSHFVAEVEKFQKHVDSLLKPTLGGYFPLDKEWKVGFLLLFHECFSLTICCISNQ